MNVKPTFAAVAPRIRSTSGATVPVVELLTDILDSKREINIAIGGVKGSGKTAALAHLAAIFPDRDDLLICDSHKLWHATHSSARVRVFSCQSPSEALELNADCWMLAEWGLDEALEYLMACHRGACNRLMPMLYSHAKSGLLPSRPLLWRKLLDLMVDDPAIATVQEGLDKIVESLILPIDKPASIDPATSAPPDIGNSRSDLSQTVLIPFAKAMLLDDDDLRKKAVEPLLESFKASPNAYDFAAKALSLLTEAALYIPVAVNACVRELTEQSSPEFLQNSLTKKLNSRAIEHVARKVANAPDLLKKLMDLVGNHSECQSMSASVLCRAVPNWRPEGSLSFLRDGQFNGVNWDGIKVIGVSYAKDTAIASVSRASFRRASLNQATFAGCLAYRTDFSNASLSEANFSKIAGRETNFSGANCRLTKFDDANLRNANFAGADCTGATFQNARLQNADLRDACFVSTNLTECRLLGANLEGTDFTLADFSRTSAHGLDFRQAILFHASFYGAKLIECNFEGQSLPMVDFIEANLKGSIFSESIIQNGSFFGANLSNARLGDIDWEDCDLRNVNLSGATFHYGSTRSGLVGSPYPSHGTRTGFYTDDFYDQPFKAPEEIRKANLRGADLRGANIWNVDFYLVDLRDARLDQNQAEHVRRCGAILEARV